MIGSSKDGTAREVLICWEECGRQQPTFSHAANWEKLDKFQKSYFMDIGTLWKISQDETKIPEMENFFLE